MEARTQEEEKFKTSTALNLEQAQRVLAEIEPMLASFSLFVERTTDWLSGVHRDTASLQAALRFTTSADEFNPCVKFLQNIENVLRIRSGSESLAVQLRRTKNIISKAHKLNQFARDNWSDVSPENGSTEDTIPCRRCNSVLRIGKNVDLKKVRCPNCRYAFYAKTTRPRFGYRSRLLNLFPF